MNPGRDPLSSHAGRGRNKKRRRGAGVNNSQHETLNPGRTFNNQNAKINKQS
jgi:hypothetical protein